uniref:Uncharacterized protein n=1 Tax=Peronospora matthiolae TaxID=2874970 RepID=A0AAV1TMD0_9STRA
MVFVRVDMAHDRCCATVFPPDSVTASVSPPDPSGVT